MDEVNKIRKAVLTQGESRHETAKKYKRSWNTVDKYVKMNREELESRGQRRPRKKTVLTEEVEQAVVEYFEEEQRQKLKKKQRYTAKFIFDDLKEKGIYHGSIRTMSDLVKRLRVEREQGRPKSHLPLSFEEGKTLQVDHGEVDCEIAGTRTKGYVFVGSIPGQAIRFAQVYPTKGRESWGQFHESAFAFFGGVFDDVMFDNDSVLVKKILGTEREQTDFSHALEEHYGFESVFCNPAAGNEKGAVENGVKFCRNNYLAGLPRFHSWAAANEHLSQKCHTHIEEAHHYRTNERLSVILERCRHRLQPLPPDKEWMRWEELKVNGYQVVRFKNHWYSVPERFVGSVLRVGISVFGVKVYDQHTLVAQHSRRYKEGEDSLHLEHYLSQLKRKPGALLHCSAVKQHLFSPQLQLLWERLTLRHELRTASKEFIEVLLLGRQYDQFELNTAVELSLESGCANSQGILTVLRQITAEPTQPHDSSWLEHNHPELTREQPKYDLSIYADFHELGGSHAQ